MTLSEAARQQIAETVAAWPPLTNNQRAQLVRLLYGGDSGSLGAVAAPRVALDRTPPPVRKCALYRHYDADGNLLYVGITINPGRRGKDHAKSSAWVEFAAREESVWFDSEEDAKAAERDAISNEAPLFNRVHAGGKRDERLLSYLIERRAFHLLRLP